jgi:iron complex outermembrane receptor protein
MEDIVVTAQRREQRLQSVPGSITALDSEQLNRNGVSGTESLQQVTPGFIYTQQAISPQPTIRGIGTRSSLAGDESVVPIYIDGVYQPNLVAANLQFNNIERVEVLRGPQGALLGRNATGGAINVITRLPDPDLHGALSVSYGRFDEAISNGYLAYGGAHVGASVAAIYTRDDGYVRDLRRNARIGSRDNAALRGTLDLNRGQLFEVRLAASYMDNDESTAGAVRPYFQDTIGRRTPGNHYGIAPYTADLSFEPSNDLIQYSASATVIVRLDSVTITSITGYEDTRIFLDSDSDASESNLAVLRYRQFDNSVYHETYLTTSDSGPLSAIAGVVYYHDEAGYRPYNILTNGVASLNVNSKLPTNSYAEYVQGTYRITPELSLTGGGRYTSETHSIRTSVGISAPTTFFRSATFTKFTPSAILQYQPSQSLNLYAKYGQAFKSGLFASSASTAAALAPILPETATQYEVGAKTDFTHWLRVNASVYYTDYRDLQSSARDPVTNGVFLQNAGGANIYGGELEVILHPLERLDIRLGAAALHGTYRNFPNAVATIPAASSDPVPSTTCAPGSGSLIGGNRSVVCDVSGLKIMRTPSITTSLSGNYSIPAGRGNVGFSGNLYYAGPFYWDTLNRIREPSKILATAQIEWQPGGVAGFRLALWGRNLLDEAYSISIISSASADSQFLGQPRTYGLRASYDF